MDSTQKFFLQLCARVFDKLLITIVMHCVLHSQWELEFLVRCVTAPPWRIRDFCG